MTNKLFYGKVTDFLLHLLILVFASNIMPHSNTRTIIVSIEIIYAMDYRGSCERSIYLVLYTSYTCRECPNLHLKRWQLLYCVADINNIALIRYHDILMIIIKYMCTLIMKYMFKIIMKYMFKIILRKHKRNTLPVKELQLLKLKRYILKGSYPLMPKQ